MMRIGGGLAAVVLLASTADAAPIHIDVQGPTSGTCISAGPHVWTTNVGTAHGGGHFRWAGYHSHKSGCEPTGENGASSYFIVDGPVEFAAGIGGLTSWIFQRPGDQCGRMQYDIDWFDWLTGWVLGVAGIMVNYGFDCRYHPPGNGESRESVPESATLLMLGLGLLWARKRMR